VPREWDESAISHDYAEVEGARIHYVEAGEGPLVLLVHGFPEYWYSWRHQILPLADAGFRVVAPDMRGTNLSSGPSEVEAYREEVLGRDLAQLIEALGAKSASVAGHDWGGWAGYWAAMHHSARIDRLAVLNVPHPVVFARARLRLYYKAIRALLIVPGLYETPFAPLSMRSTFRRELVKRGSMSDADLDRFIEVWKPPSRRPSAKPYRAQHRHWREPIEGRCRPISCPTLVIYGTEDPYMGPEFAKPPSEWVPDARVALIPGANHRVQMDRPREVTELLEAFLDPQG